MQNEVPGVTTGKPQLNKSLGLFTVILLVISSIIGSGVFKKVAPMSNDLGSPKLVIICWVLAGLMSLFGALTNAEVAGLIADSGGQYAYFKKMYGKFFAFLYGWAAFSVIQCATTAAVAYVFAQSVNSIVPINLHLPGGLESMNILGIFKPFENFGVKALTIALIGLLTWVNCRGVKNGGNISNVLTTLVVVCIFIIIIMGLFFSSGSIANLKLHTVEPGQALVHGNLFTAIFTGLLSALWAYDGWNSVGFIGGEMKNPKRDLPLALLIGVLVVIATYVLANLTYLYVVPITEIVDNFHKDDNSIAGILVVKKILGDWGGLAVSVLIIVATFNCTNSQILTAPRIYYAMAKDGLFFGSVSKVHPKFHTPHMALIISGVWSCVLVLSGSFDQLTDMLIFAQFMFYGAGAFGVFVLRVKMKDAVRPYKVPLYPVLPAIFMLFSGALVVVSIIQRPRDAGVGLALIFLGLPFYYYWSRKNAGMPVENESENVHRPEISEGITDAEYEEVT